MESYNPEYDDKFFPWIKIVGIGKIGASASNYFGEVNNEIFPERLIISDKDAVADSRDKISNLIAGCVAGCAWLFVITDVEDLEVAETFVKSIDKSELLITFLILCKSAEDARLADISKSFGTWIILPENKIAETGLTRNELIYRTVDMTTGIIPLMKKGGNFIGMGLEIVIEVLGNRGRACIGFGESLDAENNSLQAVKNALKSPLFIEDIGKAKKALLVFFGNYEFLSMLEMNEAASFLDKLYQPEDSWTYTVWQVNPDETAADGVAAFVLATDFK